MPIRKIQYRTAKCSQCLKPMRVPALWKKYLCPHCGVLLEGLTSIKGFEHLSVLKTAKAAPDDKKGAL